MFYNRLFKRIIDIFFALLFLVLLFPILFIVYILLLLLTNESVVFSQPRPGKNGIVFDLYKFRTMNNNSDSNGELLPDEKRITILGKFLRITSIDELPQLWNVLIGDMSLVGPRPLLVEYLNYYNSTQKRRHNVRPGITGWAQVNGRNQLSWEEKFDLDLWYIDNISFLLDFKILSLTIYKVFLRSGINANNADSVIKFKGTK